MKRISITEPFASLSDFKKFVDSMEVGVMYDLNNGFRYKTAYIDRTHGELSWGLERSYEVSKCIGWVYPERGRKVATFKTEAGAKRSLMKYAELLFEKSPIH